MPGYFVTQDTYHAGALKGIWRICQQTMIDTYLTLRLARLCDSETPITVADTFNARVLPFLEAQGIAISRVLAHRGTEYCGQAQGHPCELCVAVENIDHIRKARRPSASASASTRSSCRNFTRWRRAGSSITSSRNCRLTLMTGSDTTTQSAPIRDADVQARRRCRPSLTCCRWPGQPVHLVGHPPRREAGLSNEVLASTLDCMVRRLP